ncbi:DUF1642 domain-containing protein [Lactiplantibacillus plantarum]|uniref:DUF1642 domain-containing protein n=1 Tax=Lactiplantibacillus plantarum TaxID=1590 RepID=UPI001E4EF6A4|nr:DUF1642 domain-containing protein [Lactiplantibacillus plantarum]MCC6117091.1 DUF1642 domain-containing protein [Lactiplantibacillus plantarum]MCW6114639.1 DUF1642 domain-containing protein [Lactiplantibacillus plantarum]
MIKVYRKTGTIKAEQFDGSDEMINKYDIEMVEGDYAEDYSMPEAGPATYVRYFITRFDLAKGISVGDWIVTGINGERWTIADSVFKKTYAELPVIPKMYADTIEDCKANHYKLSELFADWSWNYDEQELIARAWLDGYQVGEQA